MSPNVFTGLETATAKTRLRSATQRAFEKVSDEIHERLGLAAKTRPAFGSWKDGAENLTITTLEGGGPLVRRFATLLRAKYARQTSAIHFEPDDAGQHHIYQFDVPLKTANRVNAIAKALPIRDWSTTPSCREPRGTR